jgi:transcription antitermination factor NusG
MLDAAPLTRLDEPQQDVAHPIPAPTPSGSRPVWCVVATKPKAERTAHAELHRRGFTAYLPLLTTRRRDRSWRTGPLFPGYVFVRMRLDQPWNPVRYAPGVYSLLSIDGIPSICPDAVLDALRASEALRATPLPNTASWAPGMACKPATGPFRHHPAVVISVQRETATIACIMFGHLRNVSVPLDCLKALEE